MTKALRKKDLPQAVEDHICFAVYAASHAFSRAYHPMLKDLGLTYPQYMALTALWDQDGQTVGALGEVLGLESNTLTPLLKRLEALGHVTRKRGDEDERKVFVWLTDQGRALRGRAPDITRCIIGATGMELAELKALVETLVELRENVRARDLPDGA